MSLAAKICQMAAIHYREQRAFFCVVSVLWGAEARASCSHTTAWSILGAVGWTLRPPSIFQSSGEQVRCSRRRKYDVAKYSSVCATGAEQASGLSWSVAQIFENSLGVEGN